METDSELTGENIKNLAELVKASIKLTPRRRFEILGEAKELAIRARENRSLAEIEKISRKAKELAREI